MVQDQQAVQQPKRDRRHHEQIHGGNAVSMIVKKSLPALAGGTPPLPHVLRHRGLPDLDPKLEQFAVDTRRTQSGLAMLISRISRRMSAGVAGRPPRDRDFQRQ